MKIAGVALWIWLIGVAVLVAGVWGIKQYQQTVKNAEAVVTALENLPDAPLRQQRPAPPAVSDTEKELARLEFEEMKQEVEWRAIRKEAQEQGQKMRQRIVPTSFEDLSDEALADKMKWLEKEVAGY